MRLRQVALVARDLPSVVAPFQRTFGLGESFADPGIATFGLVNEVFPVGDTFLELLSPKEPGTTAGRLLDRRGGDGGYMVIVQSQDKNADQQRMKDLGVRVVWEMHQDDGGTTHLHPRDVGGAILSLDWMEPRESWKWAGEGWQQRSRSDVTTGIAGVDLQADDPAAMAKRWGEVLAHDVTSSTGEDGEAHPTIELSEGGRIRFLPVRDGRGEGVCGLTLRVRDADAVRRAAGDAARADGTVSLCGVTVHLAPAQAR
ncbi:MAG: VOC family protein [Myxococcota bacterium]